jgi:hypothetical protein
LYLKYATPMPNSIRLCGKTRHSLSGWG